MADGSSQDGSAGWLVSFLQGREDMATPDLTKAQIAAMGQAAVAIGVLLGVRPEDAAVTAAIAALSATIGIVLPITDAAIRRERARNASQITAAKQALKAHHKPPLDVLRSELLALKGLEQDLDGPGRPDTPPEPVVENGPAGNQPGA